MGKIINRTKPIWWKLVIRKDFETIACYRGGFNYWCANMLWRDYEPNIVSYDKVPYSIKGTVYWGKEGIMNDGNFIILEPINKDCVNW